MDLSVIIKTLQMKKKIKKIEVYSKNKKWRCSKGHSKIGAHFVRDGSKVPEPYAGVTQANWIHSFCHCSLLLQEQLRQKESPHFTSPFACSSRSVPTFGYQKSIRVRLPASRTCCFQIININKWVLSSSLLPAYWGFFSLGQKNTKQKRSRFFKSAQLSFRWHRTQPSSCQEEKKKRFVFFLLQQETQTHPKIRP